jgi:hypothetical protein
MAGVPDAVIDRAWRILADLESHGDGARGAVKGSEEATGAGEAPGVVRESAGDAQGAFKESSGAARSRRTELQVDLFAAAVAENPLHRKAYEELMALDLNGLSPMQVMMKLHDLQQKLAGASPAAVR